jgi:methionyl-tRNA synthetase
MLQHAGFRLPTKIFAHGFLTVDGAKMSKSRGTFITAESYLTQKLNPEWLRYYYAAKLNGSMEDIDLNLDDFIARVNSDLVGKYINLASRSAGFIEKRFGGRLAAPSATPALQAMQEAAPRIAEAFEARDTQRAMRDIMALADAANAYVNDMAPWNLAKQAGMETQLHETCSTALALFRLLTVYLKPVLPTLAARVENFLNLPPLSWADATTTLPEGHTIRPYQHLMTRIERTQIDALLKANQASLPPDPAPVRHAEHQQTQSQKMETAPATPPIGIDDFSKVDLRIARILTAEHVEGADKLLRLQLDIGEAQPRQVFAGIKSAYDPAQLIGRLTVMVANLAPRKMKFGLSEGMVLAASDDTGATPGLFILSPDTGACPGMRVK